MSRKMYWGLNLVWQAIMFCSLHLFYQWESSAFNYHYHYIAENMWTTGAISAMISSVMWYVLLEVMLVFKKGEHHES